MHKGHILYVEDDKLVRDTLARALRRAGYYVFDCDTVELATAAARTIRFDAVICDWNVGDDTGDKVYATVERIQPDLLRRFVFLSGAHPQVDVHAMWIEKPATPSWILRVVDGLVPGCQAPAVWSPA
jgi:ActR/RegA family two-component response regulator